MNISKEYQYGSVSVQMMMTYHKIETDFRSFHMAF